MSHNHYTKKPWIWILHYTSKKKKILWMKSTAVPQPTWKLYYTSLYYSTHDYLTTILHNTWTQKNNLLNEVHMRRDVRCGKGHFTTQQFLFCFFCIGICAWLPILRETMRVETCETVRVETCETVRYGWRASNERRARRQLSKLHVQKEHSVNFFLKRFRFKRL